MVGGNTFAASDKNEVMTPVWLRLIFSACEVNLKHLTFQNKIIQQQKYTIILLTLPSYTSNNNQIAATNYRQSHPGHLVWF